ncbi:hypothetical protein QFC19_003022 [Naganishia cerealis]|uniref:Uncharacterized protein n=1 Tax=Naganishia cerealis TaxID=610337 RepID=A0ACC2W6G6_9TREE|nr:hypothetical protein QFC19_003022 [Naganishia cerealis]
MLLTFVCHRSHADLVQKYNDLENAHQALKNDYDLLQERQNQITDAIEVASRLGDDDFRNEFSDEDEDDTQQANGDDSSHENGRRAESVLDGDRGDNVISINGVDMNIDEYLAFSLAAAAAAQEGSMEHHVQEDHDQMEDSQQDSVNHDTPGGSQAGVALEGEDYHENGSLANMDHGDDHVYLPLNLPHTTDDLENTSGNTATDPSASIISALEKLNEAHGSASEHLNLEDHPLNMPMDMHESLMETRSEVHHTPEIADPHTTFSSAAISEGQESRKRKRVDEDDELNAAGAEANPATPATIADFDDDEEDDGDFVPETELGGNGDTPGLAEDDAEEAASSPEEDLPAQTQDSTLAQATQGAPQDVEDDEDDEEEDDDDEYFRIEEADYEDLFQPIEDVPIPVDDYQDIQAQYMRHLEEFNATLLREEVAQMIANESAGEISKTAHHPSATTYATVEETEAQRQAYQDTLESLGIAPDASQSAQK